MTDTKRFFQPALWAFIAVFVFEILFMISPFALHYYASYGPVLNAFHSSPATAWMTQFFLPHFSHTSSPVLNMAHEYGGIFILIGLLAFAAGAIPIYWSKIAKTGAVTGGVYRVIRHPQYVALAIAGAGVVLVWPRYLVLISYVTMLFLYVLLAKWEEELCLAKFGSDYREYQERTGMFIPKVLTRFAPFLRVDLPRARTGAVVALYVAGLLVAIVAARGVRQVSINAVAGIYSEDRAVISPADLSDEQLALAYETAQGDAAVQARLAEAEAGTLLIYVVPESWYLADLPLDVERQGGGHHVPHDFNPTQYKVLYTEPLTHAEGATGSDIVRTAYGRRPITVAHVDTALGEVTRLSDPPSTVHWGDIPTPLF